MEYGEPKYKVVYDPFCNSSLASRGILDAAVGLTVFSYEGELLVSAIMDYQTGVVALMRNGKTEFSQVQSGASLAFERSVVGNLEEAWVTVTLEEPSERAHMAECEEVLRDAGRVFIASGHIYWLRLAMGVVDGYMDPFGGEKLYEMFACSVAQGAGCVVTDREGNEFDAQEYLRTFEEDSNFRFYPVAAGNEALHRELLQALK